MPMAKPSQKGSSLQVMTHRPGTIKLCARYYNRSMGRPLQAAELAWALREETGLAQGQVASRHLWLCWEGGSAHLEQCPPQPFYPQVPRGAGEAQARGGVGAGGLCKFSLCLPTCSGVSCLDQEKDPDANQFINWPEYKGLLAAPKWQLRKECKAFACGKHSSWETLDKHCLSP